MNEKKQKSSIVTIASNFRLALFTRDYRIDDLIESRKHDWLMYGFSCFQHVIDYRKHNEALLTEALCEDV